MVGYEDETVKSEGKYTLKVKDNGPGLSSDCKNKGSKHCLNIASRLGGNFNRKTISPNGTLCELSWPIEKGIFKVD